MTSAEPVRRSKDGNYRLIKNEDGDYVIQKLHDIYWETFVVASDINYINGFMDGLDLLYMKKGGVYES